MEILSKLDPGRSKTVKLQLIGNFSTGKTTYFNQIRSFFPPFLPYPYIKPPSDVLYLPELQIDGHKWQVRLSDTSGQERYYSTPSAYLRDAAGLLLIYRTDDIQSFYDVRTIWLEKLKQLSALPPGPGPVLLLLGNNWEREGEGEGLGVEVSCAEAEELCRDISSDFGAGSSASHRLINALSGKGVRESMEECLDRVRELLSEASGNTRESLCLPGTLDLTARSYGPGDLYRTRERHCCTHRPL